jgi:hypothetical protein
MPDDLTKRGSADRFLLSDASAMELAALVVVCLVGELVGGSDGCFLRRPRR